MEVAGLNHFNIKAPQPLLQAVRDFYVEVIGLEEGFRPDFGVPGHWLYAGGNAVLHLLDSTGFASENEDAGASNYLDHIALTCTNVEASKKRLEELGVEFDVRDYSSFGLVQLFLSDPGGLGVELNFTVPITEG